MKNFFTFWLGLPCLITINKSILKSLSKVLLLSLVLLINSNVYADITTLPANVYHKYNLNNFDGLTASFTDGAYSLIACPLGISVNANNVVDTVETNNASISFTGLFCDATLSVVDGDPGDFNPGGVFAGFEVSTLDLLSAAVAAKVTVSTYLNGTLQESVVVLDNLVGVNTSLIDGSGNAIIGFVTTNDFDEIRITYKSIVAALKSFQVYNAVVKRYEAAPALVCNEVARWNNPLYPTEINSDRTGDGGLVCALCNLNNANNAISEDTTDYAQIIFGVGAIGGASISVMDVVTDYPAGHFVGFEVSNGAILDIDLLSALTIKTYRNDTLQETKGITDFISLFNYFVPGEEIQTFGFTTTQAFDEVVLEVTNVVAVLNYLKVYGAYIASGPPRECLAIDLLRIPADSAVCAGTDLEITVDSLSIICAALYSSDYALQFRYQQPDSAWSVWTDTITSITSVGSGIFKYQARRYSPTRSCGSDPVEVSWIVDSPHTLATATTATPNPICPGDAVLLSTDGIAGSNSTIGWYTSPDGAGSLLGSTPSATVYPTVNTTFYARLSGNTCASVESNVSVTVRDTGYVTLPETRAYVNLQEQCTIEDWTYFAEIAQPDKWLFAIRKNAQSVEPIFDVSLNSHSGVINSIQEADSTHGSYLMRRYWNAHLVSGSIDNGIDVRFYYDTMDLAAAILMRDVEYDAVDGDTKGPDTQWFKTNAAGGGFHPSLIAPGIGNNWDFGFTILAGKNGVENGVNYVEFNGLTSLSGGTGGTTFGESSPLLPIELNNFTAAANEYSIELDWITASEINNEKFEILRSQDAFQFSKIGEVAGNGTTNQLTKYEFLDETAISGITYYYKLRQIDYNQSSSESDIVSANLIISNEFVVGDITPNPALYRAHLDLIAPDNGTISYTIANIVGQVIQDEKVTVKRGSNRLEIDVDDFKRGNYIISIVSTSGNVIMKKLQVQ